MPGLTTSDFIIIFSSLTTLAAAALFWLERQKNVKLQQNTSQQILDEANRKAQEIITHAEHESINLVSDTKSEVKEVEDAYRQQLQQSTASAAQEYSQGLKSSMEQFSQFIQTMQNSTHQIENSSQEYAKARITEIFEQFEQNLTAFLTSTQQRSSTAIELELKSARQLIDTYKAQQLVLIDENLIAILEKTISLVLAKRLNLKDNMDLVYEALEKAKIEKFIV